MKICCCRALVDEFESSFGAKYGRRATTSDTMMMLARVNNQNSDEMSLRAQANRNRVTFSEEIEMDSLEHESCMIASSGLGLLATIQEKNESQQRDEENDVNLNEFHEFDVSESGWKKCHRKYLICADVILDKRAENFCKKMKKKEMKKRKKLTERSVMYLSICGVICSRSHENCTVLNCSVMIHEYIVLDFLKRKADVYSASL